MDCGEIVNIWLEDILWFLCTGKFHGIHGGVRCYSGIVLSRHCNGVRCSLEEEDLGNQNTAD